MKNRLDLGDASISALKKAAETLNAQTSNLKSKLMALKAYALAVTTYQAHKQLLDAIGNGDKVLADSDGKVTDGDQTRNDLTKTLDLAKNVFNDKQSVFKISSDAKAVNDADSAKAQADAQAAHDNARV